MTVDERMDDVIRTLQDEKASPWDKGASIEQLRNHLEAKERVGTRDLTEKEGEAYRAVVESLLSDAQLDELRDVDRLAF